MSTNLPISKTFPWVVSFKGKFALSLSELSSLLNTPEAQLLSMARSGAFNAPTPRFRFCIRKPTNADIYRVSRALLSELSQPLSRIDDERVNALLKMDEPTLLTYGSYLWLSSSDCSELYRHGEVSVSTFENGFSFDDLDIPRLILLDDGRLPNTKRLALGCFVRDAATNKPRFTPSNLTVTLGDIVSLVQDLSAVIDFAALEKKRTIALETSPTQQTLQELTWEDQPEYRGALQLVPEATEYINETDFPTSKKATASSDSADPQSALNTMLHLNTVSATPTGGSDTNEKQQEKANKRTEEITEGVASQSDNTELMEESEERQGDESQDKPCNFKGELPENAYTTISTDHYRNASRDLLLLLDVAESLWGDECSKEILLGGTYPSTESISEAIKMMFKEKSDVEIYPTDLNHLASLIRPKILRGKVKSAIERQRKSRFVSKVLLGLFEISTQARGDKKNKPGVTLQELLMKNLNIKEHLAKVGAKAIRGEFSTVQKQLTQR